MVRISKLKHQLVSATGLPLDPWQTHGLIKAICKGIKLNINFTKPFGRVLISTRYSFSVKYFSKYCIVIKIFQCVSPYPCSRYNSLNLTKD